MTDFIFRPNPAALASMARVLGQVQAALSGVHAGKLDRVIRLSSKQGPTLLGFLDLALELDAPGSLLHPVEAAVGVHWTFSANTLVVNAHGDLRSGGTYHQVVRLTASIDPRDTDPGLIASQGVTSTEALAYRTRKDKTRQRRTPIFLRLRRLAVARPIGTIPGPHNGQWLPFQA